MTSLTIRQAFACLTAASLVACSSSSDDNTNETIQSLTAPESVELVEPDTSNVSSGSAGLPNAGNAFPATSAYNTDVARIRLYDKTLEAVQTANGILCEVGLTRFWQFTNLGPFVAQVDPSLCGNGDSDDSQGDGQNLNLHMFTLDVTRASNSEPQQTSLWLPLTDNDVPVVINGEIEVNSGPTAGDRYGDFSLTYAGVPDGGTLANPQMLGVLTSSAGENGFRFLESFGDTTVPASNPGDRAQLLQVAVQGNGDGTGAARIRSTTRFNDGSGDSGPQVNEWRVVYDQTHVKKQRDMDPEIVLARGSFRDNVYSYNLYHNQGENLGDRVEVNSGIAVRFPGGENGWVGFFGAWSEFPESFDNGDTVTDRDDNQYTVVQAPGRLLRYSEESLLLTEVVDQPFEWWDGGTRYRVAYSGVEWQRIAQYNDSTNQWDAITPSMIDVTGAGGFLWMWSQSLGPVTYVDGAMGVDYFAREVLLGSDPIFANGSFDFYATIQGLRSEIDQTQIDNGDVYLSNVAPGSAHHYVLDPTDMTLMLDVNGDGTVLEQVGLASGITPNGGPNEWGMQSGRMVDAGAIGQMSNPEDVWNESTFYVYETGHNEWNQLVALVDGQGAYLEFDRPLEFLYTHITANDINGDNAFDGFQSQLTYNGPGRMWGIPGEEVDIDGDGQIDQWFPSFSIADGTVMGPTGGEYILRAMGVDQSLTVDMAGAPALDITDADSLVVPELSLYVTPNIGTQPEVTDPPAVIDGVVQ